MTKQEHIEAAEAALAAETEIPLDTGSRGALADRLQKRAQIHATLATALAEPAPAAAASPAASTARTA